MKSIKRQDVVRCELCDGEGMVIPDQPGWAVECPRCDGKGDLFLVEGKLVSLNDYLTWKTQKRASL